MKPRGKEWCHKIVYFRKGSGAGCYRKANESTKLLLLMMTMLNLAEEFGWQGLRLMEGRHSEGRLIYPSLGPRSLVLVILLRHFAQNIARIAKV